MTDLPDPGRIELLLEMREMRGDVRLVLQRMDQMDARDARHAEDLRDHATRLGALEREAVPRAELDQVVKDVREELAERGKRTLQILAIVATLLGTLSGVGMWLIQILTK